jgi:hypothetical protein
VPGGERPIVYAVIEWLDAAGWPLVFPEVTLPRGLIRGRVDVAAASRGFRDSVAVEVKAVHREGDAESQLFDAQRAAERVYFAGPAAVIGQTHIPSSVGILEAQTNGTRATLSLTREARRGKPTREVRSAFLHALMRSAAKRGRFDSSWTVGRVCAACASARCPFWLRPTDLDGEDSPPEMVDPFAE